MTEEEQIKVIGHGREAKALRDNPALERCMKATLDTLFAEFMATDADQGELRDALWAQAQALKQFKDTVDAYVTDGIVEEMNREQDLKQQSNNF